VLQQQLRAIDDLEVVGHRLSEHVGRYDAIVAESVLYALVPGAFETLFSLLVPGGRLAFVDMVWTELASVEGAARLHDLTVERYGIAVASRQHLTWADWRRLVEGAGFSLEEERYLGPGSPGGPSTPSRWDRALRLLRAPWLALDLARMRAQAREPLVPAGWTESWACLARRP
jgi:hypothetical protein